MERFLAALRKGTLPAIWSQGVKLAREKSVSRAPGGSPSEVVLRVRAPGFAIAPTVTLYLEENEWSCDCDGKVDPCPHIAAAAIALSQGEVGGAEEEKPPAKLAYRLGRKDRKLTLARVIVEHDGKETKIGGAMNGRIASSGSAPSSISRSRNCS